MRQRLFPKGSLRSALASADRHTPTAPANGEANTVVRGSPAVTHRAASVLPLPHRIGGVGRSLLMMLCGIGLLCGAAAIFNPSSLQAVTSPFMPDASNPQSTHATDNHQEFANTLASLVERCVEVLAVHDRGRTPYSEIVLWVDDRANPGIIDQDELAVISHSQLFRTVAVYSINSCGLEAADAAPSSKTDHTTPTTQRLMGSSNSSRAAAAGNATGAGEAGSGGSVTGARRTALSAIDLNNRQALRQSSFCDTWRGLSQVKQCVIATGVSDLRLEPVSEGGGVDGGDGELSHLRISLTWSADSVDGAGEAGALVNLSARPMSSQQE